MPPATAAASVTIQYHWRRRASSAAKITLIAIIAGGEWSWVMA